MAAITAAAMAAVMAAVMAVETAVAMAVETAAVASNILGPLQKASHGPISFHS